MTLSSGSTTQGGAISLNLSFASSGSQPTGLGWTFLYTASDILSISVAPGAAATAAGKTTSCAGSGGSYMCLVTGNNANPIPNGVLAIVTVTLASNVTSASIGIANTLGVTPTGDPYAASGTGGTIAASGPAVYHVSSLSCTPSSLRGAASTTCTITLDSAAPGGGAAVLLSSDNSNLPVPASATVSAGSTSVNFTATSAAFTVNQSATVTASANGASKSAVVSLVAPITVSSLQCIPTTLGSNASSTCTVTLSRASVDNVPVSLSSTGLSGLVVPSSVTLPPNTTTGTFTISTGILSASQSGSLTASLNGSPQSVNITLGTATPVLSSLQCSPISLASNSSSTCAVALSAAAPSAGAAVALSTTLANTTLPQSVNVPAGSTTATFSVTTSTISAAQTGPVTATYNGSSQSVTFTLVAPMVVSSLQCTPTALGSNSSSTCTVTLSTAAPSGGASVSLTTASTNAASLSAANLTMPSSVTVAANAVKASFAISIGNVTTDQTVSLTAAYSGSSQTLNVNLVASTVLSLLQCNPTTLGSNASSSCTVTLSKAAPSGGAAVNLSSNGLSELTVPATVTVTAGSTTAPFTVTTGSLTSNQSGSLTASYNSTSQSVNLSLATATVVSSLQCNPTALGSNASSNCTVTLSKAAPLGGAAVTLSASGLPSLTVPASVTVAAGSTIGAFTLSTGVVGTDQNGTVTASYNGTSKSANFSLAATIVISSLQCSPTTLGSNSGSNCTVTLSRASVDGIVVTLSSSGLSALTFPASLTVAAGSTTWPFTVSTGGLSADQNGTLTASYNGTSQTVNLSLAAATVVSSLECSPTTLGPNASTNCTVTLAKGAPASGAVVNLSRSGLSALAMPASVTIPAGSTIGPFTASTGILSVDQNGTLTASYNGTSQTINLSLAATTVISSLQCLPTTLGSNTTSNCTVTLSQGAPGGGVVVTLSSSGLPALAVPASVTVAAGTITGTFTVSTGGLTADQSGTLKAAYNDTSKTLNITLTTRTVIASLQCTPTTLSSNTTAMCTVTITAATKGAVSVALGTTLSNLSVPRSVNIPSGKLSNAFRISTSSIANSVTGPLTASYNGSQSILLNLVH